MRELDLLKLKFSISCLIIESMNCLDANVTISWKRTLNLLTFSHSMSICMVITEIITTMLHCYTSVSMATMWSSTQGNNHSCAIDFKIKKLFEIPVHLRKSAVQVWLHELRKKHLSDVTLNTSTKSDADELVLAASRPSLWSQRSWLFTSLLQLCLAIPHPWGAFHCCEMQAASKVGLLVQLRILWLKQEVSSAPVLVWHSNWIVDAAERGMGRWGYGWVQRENGKGAEEDRRGMEGAWPDDEGLIGPSF